MSPLSGPGKPKYRDPMPSRTTSCRVRRSAKPRALWFCAALVCALAAAPPGGYAAAAAESAAPAPPAPGLVVPGFWDPRRRPERPDLSASRPSVSSPRPTTRRSTSPAPDGNPAGVQCRPRARASATRLKVSCTVQMRRLRDARQHAINSAISGDAAIASIAVTPAYARPGSISPIAYYRAPARFAGAARFSRDARSRPPGEISKAKKVGGRRRHRARGLSQGPVHRRRDCKSLPATPTLLRNWR